MRPTPLVLAALLLVALGFRRQHLSVHARSLGGAAALGLIVWGSGVIHLPSLEAIARDIGAALGPYTYAVVGVMAFLETGAGTGLIAPGELAVILGGVTAGQAHTELPVLIGVVWACALTGDLTSYVLGRRLGRDFILEHGHKIKLTPARLRHVETFLARHGGKTIVVGRFIGVVRALTPFVAGSSRMAARRFIPATLVASGIWSATFSVLGYVFWRSFAQAAEIAKQGSLAFGALVILVIAAIVAYRVLHTREGRERLRSRLDRRAQRTTTSPSSASNS